MRISWFVLLFILALSVVPFAAAQEPPVDPPANDTNTTVEPPPDPEPEPTPDPEPEPELPIYDTNLADYFPKQIDVGDNQLNLYVENTGNRDLQNLVAIITGEGISTYDVTPIEILKPEQKSYIIARINARKAGRVELAIKILDDTFEKTIYVRDPKAEEGAEQQRQEEERRRQRLAAAGAQLANLTTMYDSAEEQYYAKKNEGYDISGIDLKDAKAYLRDAQASYAKSDVEQTEASLVLLQNELADLSTLLRNTQKPERSFGQWIKDNSTFVITFGYILGIIISIFTIVELVKKNKAALAEKMEREAHAPSAAPAAQPAQSPHEKPPRQKPVPVPSRIKQKPAPAKRPAKRAPAPKSRKPAPKKTLPVAKSPAPKPRPKPTSREAQDAAGKRYKLNKARPTTEYAVRPADED